MSRKMIARLISGAAALAATGILVMQSVTAAQAVGYKEYQIYDTHGGTGYCSNGIYGAPTLYNTSSGSSGAYIFDNINCVGGDAYTLYEFRNPSTGEGHDVYELYDPETNKCVAWEGASSNLFGEAGCVTANVNEQFWYGNIDTTSNELHNVGATSHWSDDRCLSALGVGTGNGIAAYKCSDNSADQLWRRNYITTS